MTNNQLYKLTVYINKRKSRLLSIVCDALYIDDVLKSTNKLVMIGETIVNVDEIRFIRIKELSNKTLQKIMNKN